MIERGADLGEVQRVLGYSINMSSAINEISF
jgi:hypothetical protein